MLTIKAEIKKGELKANGTYNVKIRFTLNRKVKRLSSSLFVSPKDLTKSGDFKKTTKIYKEIENLVQGYKNKCNEMQVDLNSYSLDDIFKHLKFEDMKDKEIDFIDFSRKWIAKATIKGANNYKTVLNSLTSFIGRDSLNISEINLSFITGYADYIKKCREAKIEKLEKAGKRVPSNRMMSLYLGSLRHLFKEAQKEYNNYDNGLILIPSSPFDNFKIPKQEATRKRALDKPCTITLDNGKISKATDGEETYKAAYSGNYLSQITGYNINKYTWENGNIVKYKVDNEGDIYNYTCTYYTDMPNKHSVFDVDAQRFDDAILAEYGNLLIMAHPTLFGLNNKNLLKSVTDSKGYTLSYTYELDGDGYPIKITETEKKNQYDSGSPEVYTLTWE